MSQENDIQKLSKDMENRFGDRIGLLFFILHNLVVSGQPCDVCFYSRKPILDIKVKPDFFYALMYGAGPTKLAEMLESIRFQKRGERDVVASLFDIWAINPMPHDGFSDEDLASVDILDGEKEIGPEGETLKEMIWNTYHCESEEDWDYFLRRFLAS